MILNTDELMQFDTQQFSTAIEELKSEILSSNDPKNLGDEDAVIVEVIDVIQEELAKRKGKGVKQGLSSDVRFLAYVNFFNTIMDGGVEEDYEDYSGEYFEEEEEEEER